MPLPFFEPKSLKKLDNKDLILKQKELETLLGKTNSTQQRETYNTLNYINEWYKNEIDQRLYDGTLEEDELEEELW